MSELLAFILYLEDPVGQRLIWVILVLFGIGGLDFLWQLWLRLPLERRHLNLAHDYFRDNPSLDDPHAVLDGLNDAGVSRGSLIYGRIAEVMEVTSRRGRIDQDVFADILIGRESRKASLANHILGVLIILGLIGTLWGLITAIIEVRPLVTDIDGFDKLEDISKTLGLTLVGMSTAFATTLAGLTTSLVLGGFGWLFNRQQSAFLTDFEAVVATTIIPHFTQTSDDSIQSAVTQLAECTNTLKFATDHNVDLMVKAIQQLMDTSWAGHLEQQYLLAEKFGETSENLLEGLKSIGGYQVLIKSTVDSFNALVENSTSQIVQSQRELQENLRDSIAILATSSNDLKNAIQGYQESQSRFVDELADTVNKGNAQLADQQARSMNSLGESVVEEQRNMVLQLSRLSDELQVRSLLEEQNQMLQNFINRSETDT